MKWSNGARGSVKATIIPLTTELLRPLGECAFARPGVLSGQTLYTKHLMLHREAEAEERPTIQELANRGVR